ncbi:MAG: FtsX-like permease family protein [Candidatus Latescibacterota bacterium]|nr:FtsX-like permease family protein [Candidatus Latescibacterota bacterium]
MYLPGLRFLLAAAIAAGCPLAARATVDYGDLRLLAPEQRLEKTVEFFSGLGSRVVGYPGAEQAALYIHEQFRLIGLDEVTFHKYDVSVPIEREAGFLQLSNGKSLTLHGLWPNLVRTSTLPEGGIDGHLLHGGQGTFEDLNGLDVEGAVVLLDFNSDDNWLKCAYLGAQAVVFSEPDSTVYLEGEKKFLTMPLDLPRFWVSKEDGDQLLREAQAGASQVHLEYRMDWERQPAWNVMGFIPGYDPLLKEDVIVLESYYDAMSVVPALAPGAEQASGITALLELARYFRDHPPPRSLLFLATSAHHLALRGIDDFIQRYLRDEDPFVDRMLVRRVVEASLARGLIVEDGIDYQLGSLSFTGKEALIRDAAVNDSILVRSVLHAAVAEGVEMLEKDGSDRWTLQYTEGAEVQQESFDSLEDLERELVDDEDLRRGFYKAWVDPKVDSLAVKLFVSLDLSSQTDELGIWNSNSSFYYKRYFAPFGKNFMNYSRQVSRALGYNFRDVLVNGISPEGGKSWETFVPGEISVNSELVLTTGTPALAFVTVNDARFLVDTPLDRADRVQYDNLSRQIRALAGMLQFALEDPELFPDFKMRLKDTLRSLKGRSMVFPRRSIVPDLPRTGAVATVRNGKKKSYKGVRGEYFEVVDETGAFFINRIRVNQVQIEAYYSDPATGRITYAPDRGIQGDEAYPMKIKMDWRDKEWMVVLFPCEAFNYYDIVDPRYLQKLSEVTVFDETNTEPVEYGFTLGEGPSSKDEPVGVLFARPGSVVKMGFGAGLLGFRSLLLNSNDFEDKEAALGEGFTIDPATTTFAKTSYRMARDMWALDEARMRELKSFAIENQRLNALHRRAGEELQGAEEALVEKNWSEFVRHTRSAIGLESRAYPDVKSTQNDVIQGIIFFMALVLPCAYFAERLLITAATITNQIIGFAVIFLVIWVILSLVHPAFELSNPLVILLAFVILVLACLVMWIITGRFNEQMKKLRTEVAVIYDTDVSRSSASLTAFLLGISNMKRRKLRTVLTFLTLLLLTFTVLSFTSIQTALRFNQIERDNEGLYEGILIRSKAWTPLEESVLEYAYSNYGGMADVAPRSWYDNKTKAHIKMKHGAEYAHNALGVLGLTPEEVNVTGLHRALMAGRWFRPGEEKVCILPNDMIAALNIAIEDVARGDGSVRIRVFGDIFTVIGVINSKRMKELKDLDDEIMTPADFAVTGGQAVQEIAEEEQREKQGLEDAQVVIKPFVHLEPANTLLIPYHTLRNIGSGNPLQSVGVRFYEGVDERREIEEFLSRLAVTLFAGVQDEGDDYIKVSIYSSLGMTSLSGMANLFVPILIAALIVLNTMMGSVYERFREIGVYSSVGLAPGHIAWLFMAESCVYSVLGVVAGYLTGQITAAMLSRLDLVIGFTLNYSSLSAVLSCILVMAVVMLSTVYPSRKASQMAVPDVTRRWRLPPPNGDNWHFEFPFTVAGSDVLGLSVFLVGYFDSYSEESIGTFYTDGAKIACFDHENGEGYTIDMNIWLAPFDLGVSQHVVIRAVPEVEHNIYQVELDIERMSGEDASWRRVNQRFMNVIRKQFLIWRTVDAEAKEAYCEEGREILAATPTAEATA